MDRKIWKNPELEKALDESQAPLWFWNDRLENEEILRQLKLQTEAGVRCTIPHGRGMGKGGYIGGYLDDDWMEKIRTVLEYKKEHDEPLWLYDEMDWPAGTCNQTVTKDEDLRERYLSFQTIEIPAGRHFTCQLRDIRENPLFGLKKEDDLSAYHFNVFFYEESKDYSGEGIRKIGNRFYRKKAIEPYIIFAPLVPSVEYFSKEDSYAVIVTVRTDPYRPYGSLSLNYLDSRAAETFLKSTYDRYYNEFPEYFGSVIKAVFNDETRMHNAFAWTDTFEDEFQKRKGYSFLASAPDLILQGNESGITRCDYYDVLSMLYQENYFGVLKKWCGEHGISLFAHLLGEETIANQARFSGDYMRQYRNIDCPGVDHLGKGIGSLNAKYAVSAARSYGKENIGVEIFAGCGWDLTFSEYIRMVTWMFQQGVQMIINHGFFYSIRENRGNDWPPSEFFQWKEWNRMPQANAMTRRLHYALSGGRPLAEVLVWHPMESFWMHYMGNEFFKTACERGPLIEDEEASRIDRGMQLLMNGLSEQNIDFDLIHTDALDHYGIKGSCIENRLNHEEYRVLVLPYAEAMPEGAVRLAADFVSSGGRVILFGEKIRQVLPKADEEILSQKLAFLNDASRCARIEDGDFEALYKELNQSIRHPMKIVEGVSTNKNLHPCYENRLIDPFIHTGEDISGVSYIRYEKDGKTETFFVNYDNEPCSIKVSVRSRSLPEVWDSYTGEIAPCEAQKEGDSFIVPLTLPSGYGIFLVTD
ncbi:MAG TPA: glycosyl hydrolase [Lachnospiraceae bacterium]|nr:glycosyl hydrolase [Lachnospiraceae bacterium]